VIIEDRLNFDDDPAPGPQPAPVVPAPVVVVPAATPTTSLFAKIKPYLPWVATTLLAAALGWQVYKDRTPGPTPGPGPIPVVVDETEDGKAWARELPLTFADSFEIARKEVLGNEKPMPDIRKDHLDRWKKTREEAFDSRFSKAFDMAIPPGNDKPTIEERRRYAEVMGQIIAGTREGAK
jgi:hypothetical protein